MTEKKKNLLRELQNYYEAYCADIRREAAALRSEPVPELTEELFSLFEKNGNRLIYEEAYFKRRKRLAVLGLKAILDGKREDFSELERMLLAVCDEECWALPAHVRRNSDTDWRICVDLFAAETAQTLAELISVLGEALSEKVRERVKEEVLRRVLVPFAESPVPYKAWEYVNTNWCAVCGGSVGSAAIYLWRDEPEKLERVLERLYDSLKNYYLQGFAEDGTCVEGLGYFTYGMTYYMGFAEQLYRFTEGRMDLLHLEKLSKIAAFQEKCYFKSGLTVSFSDGFARDTFRVGLTCFLAMNYPGTEIPPMSRAEKLDGDKCFRFMGLYRNLIWTKQYIAYLEQGEETFQVTLPNAQWTVCQSKNQAGMAAKGGHNGEPHNHNDVGSFYYISGGDVLLEDLGSGEYTRDYFAEGRYEYLCCRSLGHNVPLIDGREQLSGEAYRCDGFETDGRGRTVLSFAKAYGNSNLHSLVRTLDWNPENGELAVEDVFVFGTEPVTVTENLVTRCRPEIRGNTIRLAGRERAGLITIENLQTEIRCIEKQFSNHDGKTEDVWLLQWEVPVSTEKERAQARFHVETLYAQR